MGKVTKTRISGKDATYIAMAAGKYPPVEIGGPDDPSESQGGTNLPAPLEAVPVAGGERKAPPRVRKPSPMHDQYAAPTADLEGYRGQLREAFGNTVSDEFVNVMLGKITEALKPNPFDKLEEATMNAALAIIASAQCRSELEALIAVEIVATGFAGLRFLRQSQHNMTEDYIRTYGPYANKLLRLQLDLIHALDRHRRGHKQTVEVRHVHIYPGARASSASSIKTVRVDRARNDGGPSQNDGRPHASGRRFATAGQYGQGPPLWRQDPKR
jgi:hypothetical protein